MLWYHSATNHYCYPNSVIYNVRSATLDNYLAKSEEEINRMLPFWATLAGNRSEKLRES